MSQVDDEIKFNRKETSKITGIPASKILYYAESPYFLKKKKRPGRGVVRYYNKFEIAELALIKELTRYGFSLSEVGEIVFSFHDEQANWWDDKTEHYRKGNFTGVFYRSDNGGFIISWRKGVKAEILMDRSNVAITINVGRILNSLKF